MLCIGVKVFLFVIPASKARRESFRKDSGQAGMTNRYLAACCGVVHLRDLKNMLGVKSRPGWLNAHPIFSFFHISGILLAWYFIKNN
jgi:hypothetical protein